MPLHLIQQAISYMEEHICENINYVAAAKSVHMSGYDFHRAFRFLTGMTATEYIRNRRLTLAAQELQSTSAPVIAIAHKYGYESPESFSKAFLRFHGSTPKQAQKKGAKLHLFNPLVIKITVKGGSIMDYRMEHSRLSPEKPDRAHEGAASGKERGSVRDVRPRKGKRNPFLLWNRNSCGCGYRCRQIGRIFTERILHLGNPTGRLCRIPMYQCRRAGGNMGQILQRIYPANRLRAGRWPGL